MAELSKKRIRDRLTPRAEPYWQRLEERAYLGFRRGPDTWVARFRSRDGKQNYGALGEALEYDEAKRKAEEWLAQFAGSPVRAVKRDSVLAALEAYLVDLRRHERHDTAKSAEGRFRTAFGFDRKTKQYSDPLPELSLEAATQDDFLEWRDRLRDGRLPRTVGRLVRAVVAGLNRANQLGHLGNPLAWKLNSLSDDDENETAIFLTPAQRAALIEAASPPAARFLRSLDLTGGRPIELAAAKASDFDGANIRLCHRKGRPPKLRPRYVVLDEAGVDFFREQAKDKAPRDLLFVTQQGRQWQRQLWAAEVRLALAKLSQSAGHAQRFPEGVGAYAFRHARISELLQVHGIDPLTVAAQTGTSLKMLEKVYFKFIPSAMRQKLASVKNSS